MSIYVQSERPLGIETVLGPDALVLTSFRGFEQLSELFQFSVQLLSADGGIDPVQIVGTSVSFFVRYPDGQERWFNGVVRSFSCTGRNDRGVLYDAQVVPWLWLLTQGSDCRVHETETSKNAKDIIDQLLSGLGFTDYEWNLKRTPALREYCVQYRETHYDFLARLASEEGIFYWFRHEKGRHTLVLSDHLDGVFDCRDQQVRMRSTDSAIGDDDEVTAWNRNWEFTTGRYAGSDFNFETPSTSLLVDVKCLVELQRNSGLEFYDFPGQFPDKARGDGVVRMRIEAEEARYETVLGSGHCRSFSPGGRFTMSDHYEASESGQKWMLVFVSHDASNRGSYISSLQGSESGANYSNTFRCIPANIVFRPKLRQRAAIFGVQTALVTGPAGEELYTDKYGRIKVQFYWDRLGGKNERSSAWIRVSQVHAGKGWGMMDLPRIGEEVIVGFLEGNPDRPLILGRVYNGENHPPFSLPGEKTRRGNTTKSHKATGFNEMSMDDTAGKEQLRINAQYNMDTNVNNNQTLNVGVDRKNEIGGNEDIHVAKDQTLKVDANQTIEIGSVMKVTVGSDQQVMVRANRKDEVTADETSKVGGKQSLTVGGDQSESVGGKQQVTVSGDASLSSGMKIKIEATASIELICGSSTIKIDPTGVQIKGAMITVEGTATTGIKAPMTTVEGNALLTLNGAMTKIN
ncbi:MAG: type VI secretion system tip protein TssI/VgrG [Planctomycetia bacterium]